jgi:hypothetical protein
MPSRNVPRGPFYRLRRPTDRGVVHLDGCDTYLGKHRTSENHAAYKPVISEWLVKCCQLPPKDTNQRVVRAPHAADCSKPSSGGTAYHAVHQVAGR